MWRLPTRQWAHGFLSCLVLPDCARRTVDRPPPAAEPARQKKRRRKRRRRRRSRRRVSACKNEIKEKGRGGWHATHPQYTGQVINTHAHTLARTRRRTERGGRLGARSRGAVGRRAASAGGSGAVRCCSRSGPAVLLGCVIWRTRCLDLSLWPCGDARVRWDACAAHQAASRSCLMERRKQPNSAQSLRRYWLRHSFVRNRTHLRADSSSDPSSSSSETRPPQSASLQEGARPRLGWSLLPMGGLCISSGGRRAAVYRLAPKWLRRRGGGARGEGGGGGG